MAPYDEPPVFWAVRTTKRARSDMEATEERLEALAGEEIAEAWSEGLNAEIAKLAQFPASWPVAEENKLFRENVRRMLCRRTPSSPAYRVLFVLRENPADAPAVMVIHLRHAAQKPMTRKEARKIEESE